jgi:lipoyl(octanoyl) transferase
MTGVWTQIATSTAAVIPSGANHPELAEGERAQSRDPYASPETQAKIAAIGVHISRGVTSHGFALNVTNQPLEYFQLIVPCGISTKPVTSLEQQLCGPGLRPGIRGSETRATPSMDEVAQSVARNFGRVFNSQIVWVDSLDALRGRSVGVPARAPEELRKMAGEEDTFWA